MTWLRALALLAALALASEALAQGAEIAAVKTELTGLPDGKKFSPERANLNLKLARLELAWGRYFEAEQSATEAAANYARARDGKGEAEAYGLRGEARILQGRYEQASGDLSTALDIVRKAKDASGLAATTWRQGELARALGDQRTALALYEEARKGFAVLGDEAGEGKALFSLGKSRQVSGDFAGAITDYASGAALLEKGKDPLQAAYAYLNAGFVARTLRDAKEAEAHFVKSAGLFSETRFSKGEAEARLALGDLKRAQKNDGEAEKELQAAAALFRAASVGVGEAMAEESLGHLYRASGDNDRALVSYETALAFYRRHGTADMTAPVLQSLGDLERWFGRPEKARSYYIEALRFYQFSGDALGQANVLLGLGLVESGPSPDLALDHFARSADFYLEAGMPQASTMAKEAASRLKSDLKR
ncbi:MAG TPA: tetratricopeptide repeat protein [Sphingomonadales bacterium]|nr:tetratricopeptide repeat protein [Sphingomonadales bacterium]